MDTNTIVVTVCGGEVQSVETGVENARIIIRDYDEADRHRKNNTKPIGTAAVKVDEHGEEYVEAIFQEVNIIEEEGTCAVCGSPAPLNGTLCPAHDMIGSD